MGVTGEYDSKDEGGFPDNGKMDTFALAAIAFSATSTLVHIATIGLALRRAGKPATIRSLESAEPRVTILRPVCGMDAFEAATLGSSFTLTYPNVEIIFCCARAQDPVVPLVQRLIAENPHVKARLLIGDDRSTQNPKLNNLVKGWEAAASPLVLMADSNVLMPPTYVEDMLCALDETTGLVCSPPIGCSPDGLWAEVECAFLNTYQARWQLSADAIGFGFAQGKSMLWRREDLEAAGGIRALALEIAEDAAATKIVRKAGKKVRLVDRPFAQPLGAKTARQMWDRQVRWARLRRATFLPYFVPELFTGSFFPALAAAFAAPEFEMNPALVWLSLVAAWLAGEGLLAARAGWHFKVGSPLAWLMRDLLIPVLWVQGLTGSDFTWRGNTMTVNDYRGPDDLALEKS